MSKKKSIRFPLIPRAAFVGVCLALTSSVVAANPVVVWDYSTQAYFTNAVFGPSSSLNDLNIIQPYELSWGYTSANFQNPTNVSPWNNRSALTVGDPTATPPSLVSGAPAEGKVNTTPAGQIPSGAQIGVGVNFTHWNNPINADFSTLTSATVRDELTLTAFNPYTNSAYTLPPVVFEFQFRETPNAGNSAGLCADGSVSTYNPATGLGGCPDLFGFINTPTLNQMFTYADPGPTSAPGDDIVHTYFASILVLGANGGISPIGNLAAGECLALGYSGPCQGFRTQENAQTTVQFAFVVTAEPIFVPEPGTLAMLGLALAGIGVASRRKAN